MFFLGLLLAWFVYAQQRFVQNKKGRSRSETMFSCPLGTALSLLSSELNLDLPLPLSHVGGDGDSFKLSLLKDGTFRFISLRQDAREPIPLFQFRFSPPLDRSPWAPYIPPNGQVANLAGVGGRSACLVRLNTSLFLFLIHNSWLPFLIGQTWAIVQLPSFVRPGPTGTALKMSTPALRKMERKVLSDDCPFYLDFFATLSLWSIRFLILSIHKGP